MGYEEDDGIIFFFLGYVKSFIGGVLVIGILVVSVFILWYWSNVLDYDLL